MQLFYVCRTHTHMGIADKIEQIEAEMARTQRNKATEHHLGVLKAKLAKYRAELNKTREPGSKTGDGFEVTKVGDARVALIGFPSVGKSTLLSLITDRYSKQSEIEFTTLTCLSGKLEYNGASIQILDLPGIIDGAASNRGRGRQVISVARTADLIVMLLDPQRPSDKEVLTRELSEMGIRLNRRPPNVNLIRSGAGIEIMTTCRLTNIDENTIRGILKEYKIHNCQLTIHDDITDNDLIDVIGGGAVYVDCIFCYNKIDRVTFEDFKVLAASENTNFLLSCHKGWNVEELKGEIWRRLGLVRVYTRKRGEDPDFEGPVVLRNPARVKDLCRRVHRDFEQNFKYAMVWGRSASHSPQRVGLNHTFCDEDVVQLYSK